MITPVAWCFGTAAPATVLLHSGHHSLTVGGMAGVAWLLVPGSWTDRARALVGGPDARRGTNWVALAVIGSATAALIHLLVVPGHARAEAGPWLAPGFLLVALLQAAWAYAVARGVHRAPAGSASAGALLPLGIALHASALAVWLLSRTAGLPQAIYPGPTPAVGLPDLFAAVCQVAALVAICALMRMPEVIKAHTAPRLTRWSAWPAQSRLAAAAAGSGLVAIVAVGGLL